MDIDREDVIIYNGPDCYNVLVDDAWWGNDCLCCYLFKSVITFILVFVSFTYLPVFI